MFLRVLIYTQVTWIVVVGMLCRGVIIIPDPVLESFPPVVEKAVEILRSAMMALTTTAMARPTARTKKTAARIRHVSRPEYLLVLIKDVIFIRMTGNTNGLKLSFN